MADKSIRIEQLPVIAEIYNDDALVLNSTRDETTYQIAWADVVNGLNYFPQGIIVPLGDSADTPKGLAIGDYRSGIWANVFGTFNITTNGINRYVIDQTGNTTLPVGDVTIGQTSNQCTNNFTVYNITRFYCDVTIDGNVSIGGDLDVGGGGNFGGDLNVTGDGNFGGSLDVIGDGHFGGDVTIDKDIILGGGIEKPDGGLIDLEVNNILAENITINGKLEVLGGAHIEGGLDVDDINLSGTITGGNGIFDELTVNGTITGGDFNGDNINLEGDLHVEGETQLDGDVSMGNNLDVSGNINFDGLITGDGSQLENLNIPDSLNFKGDIDITAAPPTAENGDFYLVVVTAIANSGFGAPMGGTEINKNTFVYYSVDAGVLDGDGNPTYKWFPGANTDDEGLVSVNGAQIIAGVKTFTAKPLGQYTIDEDEAGNPIVDLDDTLVNKKYVNSLLGDLDLDDLHDVEIDINNPVPNTDTGYNQVLWLDYDKDADTGTKIWKNVALNTAMVPLVSPDGSNGVFPFNNVYTLDPLLFDFLLTTPGADGTVDEGLLLPATPFYPLPDHSNLQSQAGANDWFHQAIHTNYLFIHENAARMDAMDLDTVCKVGNNTTTDITIATDKIILTATGNGTFVGNGTFGGTLDVTGNTTVGGTLGVTGATTLSDTLNVTGATTLSSTLGVTGATTLSSTLDVTGDTTLSAKLGVTGATTLSSTLDVTGDTTLSAKLDVTGATTLSDTLDVTGATTLKDKLSVTGDADFVNKKVKIVTAAPTGDKFSDGTEVDSDYGGGIYAFNGKVYSLETENDDPDNTCVTKKWIADKVQDAGDGSTGTAFFWTRSTSGATPTLTPSNDGDAVIVDASDGTTKITLAPEGSGTFAGTILVHPTGEAKPFITLSSDDGGGSFTGPLQTDSTLNVTMGGSIGGNLSVGLKTTSREFVAGLPEVTADNDVAYFPIISGNRPPRLGTTSPAPAFGFEFGRYDVGTENNSSLKLTLDESGPNNPEWYWNDTGEFISPTVKTPHFELNTLPELP